MINLTVVIIVICFVLGVGLIGHFSSQSITKDINNFNVYKNKILDIISNTKTHDDNIRNQIEAMFEKLETMIVESEHFSRNRIDYEKIKAYYKGKYNIPLEMNV